MVSVQDSKHLVKPKQNGSIANKHQAYLDLPNKYTMLNHFWHKESELFLQKTSISLAPAEELWTEILNPEPYCLANASSHPYKAVTPWPCSVFHWKSWEYCKLLMKKNCWTVLELWDLGGWNLLKFNVFFFIHFKDVYELLSGCYCHL